MSHAGQVVSRDQIIHAVWPQDFEGGSNVVDTYVHYLREKIDRSPARRLIRTVRGVGYVLEG
jgi:DNA-binding response OmpR family regulator